MPPRYISASELVIFAFRKRAWFLEHQGQPSTLIQARAMESADSAGRARAVWRAPTTARILAVLLVLGGIGIACAVFLARIPHPS
jgi:hypothetical protein